MDDNGLIHHATNYLPFIGMATRTPGQASPIITRLIEAAIIGGVTMYGSVYVLRNDIDWIKSTMSEFKVDIRDVKRQVHDIENRQIVIMNTKADKRGSRESTRDCLSPGQ